MLTLRLEISGAELDGDSILLPGDPAGATVVWSFNSADQRVVDYRSIAIDVGQVRPRQDYQLAGIELAQRPENPIDFLQTVTSSPKTRAGVPQIDDFLVTKVSIAGAAPFTPIVKIRESVPNAAALFTFDGIPMVQDAGDPLVWHSTRCALLQAGQSLGLDSGGVSSDYVVYVTLAPLDRVDATAAICALAAAADVVACPPEVSTLVVEDPLGIPIESFNGRTLLNGTGIQTFDIPEVGIDEAAFGIVITNYVGVAPLITGSSFATVGSTRVLRLILDSALATGYGFIVITNIASGCSAAMAYEVFSA